jgi:hypothetical protein
LAGEDLEVAIMMLTVRLLLISLRGYEHSSGNKS